MPYPVNSSRWISWEVAQTLLTLSTMASWSGGKQLWALADVCLPVTLGNLCSTRSPPPPAPDRWEAQCKKTFRSSENVAKSQRAGRCRTTGLSLRGGGVRNANRNKCSGGRSLPNGQAKGKTRIHRRSTGAPGGQNTSPATCRALLQSPYPIPLVYWGAEYFEYLCISAHSKRPQKQRGGIAAQLSHGQSTPPPPCASTLKVSKTTVTRAHVLRQGSACARRAVPKERMSPETCPYLTLSTIVATGHYNTMCRQISASSGGPSGPLGAVE